MRSTPRPPGPLGDTPQRSYGEKLGLFSRFAEPELRSAIAQLPISPGQRILDAGCGTGGIAVLLAEQVMPGGCVIGIDLAAAHLALAVRGAGRSAFVQADLTEPPFAPRTFDGVWISNALNHVHDPIAALRRLMALTRPGGWFAIAQSHFLPEMMFAWDERLERAVTQACRRHYRERYGLDVATTGGARRLVGIARDAGLVDVVPRTLVIERSAPLSDIDEAYFHTVVIEGSWCGRVEPYLDPEDRAALERACDPDGNAYCLRRPDFHALQTFTVVHARVAPERSEGQLEDR